MTDLSPATIKDIGTMMQEVIQATVPGMIREMLGVHEARVHGLEVSQALARRHSR